ncbi:polysaccharide deacetylase family protein [Echinicola marina]|uniref:polysaccharide deacetylase family protein n=1 Tax=Echinicola marina TaxID=2859768 RepID=UPI001CF62F23|nr:polysaccharide deacetylase family protein [Echinicola marina]UCS92931.1 polysaccharide deacetylase family protein [Echinicola marina]
MKHLSISLFFLVICFQSTAQEKKICITVDDLPTVTYGINDIAFHNRITQSLVLTFIQEDVPAIGYVNESKLYEGDQLDSAKLQLLEYWLSQGLELGNHTFSHSNYHEVGFDAFTSDIIKGENILKILLPKYHQELKFFRHPYLRSGKTKELSDQLGRFLINHNYIAAPVTVDNDDYLFAFAYSKAYKKGDEALMKRIGKAYIDYMEEKVIYFEQSAQKLFNRNINQILLCHANLLNADYMEELVKRIRDLGYKFISQDEALQDPAYNTVISKYGDWGISWLDRWAISMGKKADFFKDDPVTPKFIKSMNH